MVKVADHRDILTSIPLNAEEVARPGLPSDVGSAAIRYGDTAGFCRVLCDVQNIRLAIAVEVAGVQIVILRAPRGRSIGKRSQREAKGNDCETESLAVHWKFLQKILRSPCRYLDRMQKERGRLRTTTTTRIKRCT